MSESSPEPEPQAVLERGKVTIVGAGPIGTACGMTLAMKGTAREIVFLDEDGSLAHAEGLDILQGQSFTKKTTVEAGLDLGVTKNSDIIVIAFGTRLRKDMTSLEQLADFNLQNYRRLIPELVKNSPEAIFIVTSQPNEVACYMLWKIAGISTSRVIGIGTNLATSRFRTKIRENLGANDDMIIDGFMIGECSDPFPAWMSVTLNGTSFKKMNPHLGTPQDHGGWNEIVDAMKEEDAWLKDTGRFYVWSVGLVIKDIIEHIFENEIEGPRVHTVAAYSRDFFGIRKNVFLSLPCYINRKGIRGWYPLELDKGEEEKFRESSERIISMQEKFLIYGKKEVVVGPGALPYL